jgi:hypothetical protein
MTAMACADCWAKWTPNVVTSRDYTRRERLPDGSHIVSGVHTIICFELPARPCPFCGSGRVGEVEDRPRLDRPMLVWRPRKRRWESVYRPGEDRAEIARQLEGMTQC